MAIVVQVHQDLDGQQLAADPGSGLPLLRNTQCGVRLAGERRAGRQRLALNKTKAASGKQLALVGSAEQYVSRGFKQSALRHYALCTNILTLQ